MDLQSVRAALEAVARDAGAAVMQYYEQPHQETVKSNIFDVVTEGDKASEAVIIPALRALVPEATIVSEEGGGGEFDAAAAYSWHIDPIDGTTNFANNLPFFCISIALAGRDLVPLVGVVFNPVYNEMFSAARGFGATLNGRVLHVSPHAELSRAVLSTGFPYDRNSKADNNLAQWEAILMQARDLRRFGSAALDMSFVAAGRLDGFWEKGIHSWDCQAGLLMIQEAGGRTSDYSGSESAKLYLGEEIVVTNGLIHEQVLAVLNGAKR